MLRLCLIIKPSTMSAEEISIIRNLQTPTLTDLLLNLSALSPPPSDSIMPGMLLSSKLLSPFRGFYPSYLWRKNLSRANLSFWDHQLRFRVRCYDAKFDPRHGKYLACCLMYRCYPKECQRPRKQSDEWGLIWCCSVILPRLSHYLYCWGLL